MKNDAADRKPKESASRQLRHHLEVVRYLAAEGRPRSAEEIHAHLTEEIGMGMDVRSVQRWLKEMREDEEHLLHDFIRVRPVSAAEIAAGRNRRTIVAEAVGRPLPAELLRAGASGGEILAGPTPGLVVKQLSVEEAWLLRLAEDVLDKLIPQEFFDNSLQSVFRAARAVLDSDPAMKRLASRIVYVPRGQRLHEAPAQANDNVEITGTIMAAIRAGKMLAFVYRNEDRERAVHPCALIYREPKLYLRAIPDGESVPREFLCARMSDVDVLARNSEVPEDYRVDPDSIDLNIHDRLGLPPGKVRLLLRLRAQGKSNLVDDLQRYRLDPQQVLADTGNGNWTLTVPAIAITMQLVEWIAGRLDAVEVLEPAALAKFLQRG